MILTDEADLFSSELIEDDLNLISVPKIEGKMRVKAKVRYRHAEQPATVEQLDEKRIFPTILGTEIKFKSSAISSLENK